MKKLSLDKIVLKTKKYIFGDLLGNKNSKILGDGYDFAQISPYIYGQNIRRIDAYSSAKKNELHVRDFYESKDVHVHLVVCASGSLHFGTKRFKQDVIAEVLALLGFSAIKDAQSVSYSLVGEKVLESFHTKKTKSILLKTIENFLKKDLKGKSVDYSFLNSYLLKQKRSLVFLIGDFFELPKIKSAAKKHEIVLIRVRDIFENNPSFRGEIDVLNPISMKNSHISFDKYFAKKYKEKLRRHDLHVGEYLKRLRIEVIDIFTYENIYQKIEKSLKGWSWKS
ncbi:MAG TPA: hypothetical protein CFH82_00975 [Sulfurospirillum sp. UBA12182]|nr:MAG TPA: hypothetical protein CFH82_00975 [Sulfurospirillum sp. UBA12182]